MGWGELHAAGGRSLLENVAEAVKIARSLRYENPLTFDDVTTPELENVKSGLRAIAYSCQEGARKIERIIAAREKRTSGNSVTVAGERTALEILEDPALDPGVIELRDPESGRTLARIVDVEEPGS